jgi:hypothetical protein
MTAAPDVVAQYQNAHDRHDVDRASPRSGPMPSSRTTGTSTTAAMRFGTGCPERRLSSATRGTLTGADAGDANTWLVTNRLEGKFPGGVVELRYRFVLIDDLISELEIAP